MTTIYPIEKQKTREDYSKISEVYISDFGGDTKNFNLIDKLVETVRERRMLLRFTIDLGCGPGNITGYLINRGITRLIAVDITPEFCEYVKKKYGHEELVQLVVLENDMVDVVKLLLKPFQGLIAAVTAGFSIIHIPDNEVDELLKDIYDLLIPGGQFYMSCYEGKHKGMEFDPQFLAVNALSNEKPKTQERLEVYMNYFTEDELRKRIEKTGLVVTDLERTKPEVLPGEIAVPRLQVLVEKPASPAGRPQTEEIYVGSSTV